MFATRTEMKHRIDALPPNRHYEITYRIVDRRTGRRAAVEIAGTRDELNYQLGVMYADGFAVETTPGGGVSILNFTRRNTTRRIALGANRTSYGY